MVHEAKIQWRSTETTPNGDPFFTVKKARNYYYFGERGGTDSIFFILYNKDTDKFALISESKPPMDEGNNKRTNMTTAMGGSCDMDLTKQEICQIEVREECGYDVPLYRIEEVGSTLVSTQMNQTAYGFIVNVTGYEKTLKAENEMEISQEQMEKDPTEFSGNSIIWMTIDEVFQNSDWKSIFIVSKYNWDKSRKSIIGKLI